MSTQQTARHSPWPWWTTDSGGVRNVGGYICHTNSVQRYEGQEERYAFEVAQREADKRLIAEAPELLETLREARALIVEAFSHTQLAVDAAEHGTVKRIDAAIARATTQEKT